MRQLQCFVLDVLEIVMDKENGSNLFNGGREVIFFLVSYYSPALVPGSITLMLSTGPQHRVAIYHLSWQASCFILHLPH